MIQAKGTFFHSFIGAQCVGIIGLSFASAEEARDALSTLGKAWKLSPKNAQVLCATPTTSEELGEIKALLKEKCKLQILPCGWKHCRRKCKDAEIDNISHSIDRGANFTLEIPRPVPVEQTKLFG